jgi:formimidoylglutamate deiminase
MSTQRGQASGALLWAPRAWVDGRWQDAVLLRIGDDGHWAEVQAGSAAPPQAFRLPSAVLPGLVDAHSHAFQRAFAGLAERRDSEHDDFWSWRDGMYKVALRITPAQLRAVASQLYAELLQGGYTHVCEFHYLQHDRDGRPYPDPLELSWALADAAADTGIGLTLLPVLYQRAGFNAPRLRDDQRRFATDAAAVLSLQRGAAASGRARVNAGVAIHSLRAADPAAMQQLVDGLGDVPIHMHVAEQTSEVDDCLAATGQRPIEWLCAQHAVDPRWQLVHATHALPAEMDAVANCGAGVVICPSTEANLGDGLTDLPGWLRAGVPLAVGSDSQATRSWSEELRWMEYGQRLQHRRRNVFAAPGTQPSSAARMLGLALPAGGRAAGFARWGLEVGARADLLLVDVEEPALQGVPADRLLDALVFASPARPFCDVMVGGRWVMRGHRLLRSEARSAAFGEAMQSLWNAT